MVSNPLPIGMLALLCSLTFGCSGSNDEIYERAAVRGQVSVNGKPIPQGLLKFVPLTPQSAPPTPVPIVDGEFRVNAAIGPIVGKHRVEVVSTDDGGFAWDDEQALNTLAAMKKPPRIEVVTVPPVYSCENSPLQANVIAEGPNDYTFALTTR